MLDTVKEATHSTGRIVFAINSLATGGAETSICELAKAFAQRGETRVSIVILHNRRDEAWRLDGTGVDVVSLDMKGRWDILGGARRLRRYLQSARPDVVHAHLFPTLLVVALAALRLRTVRPRLVFTEHGEDSRRFKHRWFRPVDRWAYRAFDTIICVSAATRQRLSDWIPSVAGRTITVSNAVEVHGMARDQNASFEDQLLYVGRLEPVKGLDVLLGAVHELHRMGEPVTLRVVGDGSMRDPWESLSRELGLEKVVRFVGKSSDVAAHMQACRVLVMPSRSEGMPMVMLEAMAAGMPIVATRVGGSAELISQYDDDALVPPENSKALASALASMLRSIHRQANASLGARALVARRYSLARSLENLTPIYNGNTVSPSAS